MRIIEGGKIPVPIWCLFFWVKTGLYVYLKIDCGQKLFKSLLFFSQFILKPFSWRNTLSTFSTNNHQNYTTNLLIATVNEFPSLWNLLKRSYLKVGIVLYVLAGNSNFMLVVYRPVRGKPESEFLLALESRILGVESRILGVESRILGVESRILGVESRILGVEYGIQEVESRNAQAAASLLSPSRYQDAFASLVPA